MPIVGFCSLGRLDGIGGSSHNNLVIAIRVGFPRDAGEARQSCLRRTDNPNGATASAALTSLVCRNGILEALDEVVPIYARVGLQMQSYVIVELDGRKARFHHRDNAGLRETCKRAAVRLEVEYGWTPFLLWR